MSTSDEDMTQPTGDRTAFDRVKSTAMVLDEPHSAREIADKADVAEHTARKHLNRLVDLQVLLQKKVDRTTLYAPDPLHHHLQMARDLIDKFSEDELTALKSEKKSKIHDIQERYGVEAIEELREKAVDVDDTKQYREMKKRASDWAMHSASIEAIEMAQEIPDSYERQVYNWDTEATDM